MRAIVPTPALPRATLAAILRATLLYAVFAALWILLSDSAVERLFADPASRQIANTLKGLAFVAITTLLLFFLLMHFAAAQGAAAKLGADGTLRTAARRTLFAGIGLLALVFVLLAADGARKSWQRNRAAADAQLQSVARLKAAQLESWLAERLSDVRMAGGSSTFAPLLPRWRAGDAQARQRLLARLEDYRATYRYHGAMLCDAAGTVLLQAGAPEHGASEVLRAAVQAALASGAALMTDIYPMAEPSPEHGHLDFVAPLAAPAPGRQAAAVVLRADLGDLFRRHLQTWPVPSESAETLLIRRDGDGVRYLNAPRHRSEAPLGLRLPLARAGLIEAQVLAAGHVPGSLLEGTDYRGMPVLGVALPVAGTPWWIVAKADRREILGAAYQETLWIAVASLLLWGVAVIFAALLLQRRELRHAQRQRREQDARLHALSLLAAIADNSADAIFAKDRQGRYLLFNQAASRFTGKTEAEVLGRDDGVLFPPEQAALVQDNDRRVMDENRQLSYEETLATPAGPRTFLAVKGPLHGAEGEVIGMFGISRDISERALAEEQLRRGNDELQRFNRAMVGRELEMVRLKQEINAMARTLGRAPPYPFTAAGEEAKENPPPEQA